MRAHYPPGFVDGEGISRESFEQYKAVFTNPDGIATVSDADVLLSLINQSLVRREASRIGLVVTEAQLDEAIEHWGTLDIAPTQLEQSGGFGGLRNRFRSFAEMKLVRDAVISPVHIPDEALRAAHGADFGLNSLPFEDVAETLRQRLMTAELDDRWVRWLAARRSCAEIEVVDGSLGVASSSPNGGCN